MRTIENKNISFQKNVLTTFVGHKKKFLQNVVFYVLFSMQSLFPSGRTLVLFPLIRFHLFGFSNLDTISSKEKNHFSFTSTNLYFSIFACENRMCKICFAENTQQNNHQVLSIGNAITLRRVRPKKQDSDYIA